MLTIRDATVARLQPRGPRGPTGAAPAHEWVTDTSVRFKNPDGSWGATKNLIGPEGPSGSVQNFDTLLIAEASSISVGVNFVRVFGREEPGDLGYLDAMTFQRVTSEPAHTLKFQDAASAWFEFVGFRTTPEMFGAKASPENSKEAFLDIGLFWRIKGGIEIHGCPGREYLIDDASTDINFYIVYSTATDFIIFDGHGCTVTVERDWGSDPTNRFAYLFQGTDIANVELHSFTAQCDVQTSLDRYKRGLFGSALYGVSENINLDFEQIGGVAAWYLFQSGGAETTGARRVQVNGRAHQTGYGMSLSCSGGKADVCIDTDGCYRSSLVQGIGDVKLDITSRNHVSGDVVLAVSAEISNFLRKIRLDYHCLPATDRVGATSAENINFGGSGGSGRLTGITIDALIENASGKEEGPPIVTQTDAATGYIIEGIELSVRCIGAAAFTCSLFTGGSWLATSSFVRDIRLKDWRIEGSSSANVVLGDGIIGGYCDIENLNSVGSLTFTNGAVPMMRHVHTSNLDIDFKLPTRTLAALPAASRATNGEFFVSDGASNKKIVISDGTTKRYADGAAV